MTVHARTSGMGKPFQPFQVVVFRRPWNPRCCDGWRNAMRSCDERDLFSVPATAADQRLSRQAHTPNRTPALLPPVCKRVRPRVACHEPTRPGGMGAISAGVACGAPGVSGRVSACMAYGAAHEAGGAMPGSWMGQLNNLKSTSWTPPSHHAPHTKGEFSCLDVPQHP